MDTQSALPLEGIPMSALRETLVAIVAGCAAVLRDVSAYKLRESQPDDAPMLPSYWASSSPLSFLPPIRALPDVTALSCASTLCPPAQLRRLTLAIAHWARPRFPRRCTYLSGRCGCGSVFLIAWLRNHGSSQHSCKPLRRLLTDIRWRPLSVGLLRASACSESCTAN